ncbi:hypothetical protein F2981_18570 (plasmid) [Sinorhizobium meliloti]|nr:hypothetical protein [Sinorhizobium meliloti]
MVARSRGRSRRQRACGRAAGGGGLHTPLYAQFHGDDMSAKRRERSSSRGALRPRHHRGRRLRTRCSNPGIFGLKFTCRDVV